MTADRPMVSLLMTAIQDVNFTGGVVHVINKVLTIPQNISYTAQEAGLSALVGALGRTNLVQALDSTPNLTVFAPSNEAFQAIGSATANLSMMDLASILQYHGELKLLHCRQVRLLTIYQWSTTLLATVPP